jgi:glycosyltransferase XagB
MMERATAQDGLRRPQIAAMVFVGATLAALSAVSGHPVFVLAAILSPLFLLQALFNLGAALERQGRAAPPAGDPPDWPAYTVLVPLYDEASVAPALVASLDRLSYPRDRMQVLFLVEADDDATIAALTPCLPGPAFSIAIVPPGGPRTKPNALNHGLSLATGAFVTVYDAEDAPDTRQLKDAASAFLTAPDHVVCLQARLVIDNGPDGWLALMMSIEYASLFDATKCGFASMALPVALGGTSNHFRTQAIRALGGWDAWNVAEDADMGLRIARAGGYVRDLPSVTLEEAPFRLSSWFAQRRRWQKGFMQTAATHSRQPWRAFRDIGWLGWTAGMVQVAGSVMGALFFPIFTAQMLWLAASGALFDNRDSFAAVSNTLALWVACCGLMSTLVPAFVGLSRRRAWHLAPWLVTMPLYQLLISAAAWVAIIDYIRAPSRWLKTAHGEGRRDSPLLRSRTEWRS